MIDLQYIAENVYGRYVPDDVELVERNGYIFFAHPTRRYDPVTLLALTGAVSTGIGVAQTLEEGKQAERIAERRAEIDLENAEAVRESAVEEATIEKERSVRARASAKAAAAAGGIRINQGLPLVIDTQIAAATAKDIGFILQRGRVTAEAFRSSARIEIAQGKALRRKSRFDALRLGLQGFQQSGAADFRFGKKTNIAPAGTFKARTGISQVDFGRKFISQ